MNKSQNFSLTLAFILALTHPAFATPADDLAQTNKEIRTANANAEKFSVELKKLKAQEKILADKMIKTAGELQASEAELSALEEKMRILNSQIEEKTQTLSAKKKNMAVMVQAAVKLSQTPEEAIILMPGDMQNNMKASRALKMTTDSIKKEAESIRAQMAELAELKEKVSANKIDAEKRKADLEEQRKILKAQIAEHNATQAKIMGEQKAAKAKAQSLAKKAQDLKGLIESLEQEKIEQRIQASKKTGEEIEADNSAPSGYKGKLRSFKSAKGKVRVPAAGRLVQKFGENGRNDTSKGVTISTRANAQVTAPFDAEVIFTGPFMDYGRVIILRHSDGFHTLLSGLARIDASVGNYLLEGEPLGNMGERDQSTKLYMELREDNNPINPAPWVKGMNR